MARLDLVQGVTHAGSPSRHTQTLKYLCCHTRKHLLSAINNTTREVWGTERCPLSFTYIYLSALTLPTHQKIYLNQETYTARKSIINSHFATVRSSWHRYRFDCTDRDSFGLSNSLGNVMQENSDPLMTAQDVGLRHRFVQSRSKQGVPKREEESERGTGNNQKGRTNPQSTTRPTLPPSLFTL